MTPLQIDRIINPPLTRTEEYWEESNGLTRRHKWVRMGKIQKRRYVRFTVIMKPLIPSNYKVEIQ